MDISNSSPTGFSEAADNHFLIAGIGASAGGVGALRTFFEHVPADSGIAYVVILHLSPTHDSQLAEVLSAVAKIPVNQVTEKVTVKPNCVYVVPPNQHLEMMDGEIMVSPNLQLNERRAPVDIFFRTLAESHKAHAVAIILSGTGADGSMGLKRVKENGGTVYVQNPREAEYSDMPRNAIATELVDEILNVASIPEKMVAFKNSIGTVDIPIVQGNLAENQQAALREIFAQLRVRTGHDFSNYKRATVLRRIERRINVRGIASLSDYAQYLISMPEEAQALLKDLLISVTNFFRDFEAFHYLEKSIIPRLLANRKENEPVRVWVAGCATGEEAYTIAMLISERLDGVKDTPPVQIFATDIDETALAAARDGWYSLNDAADVNPERLRRFFTAENDGFRVKKELRDSILFAVHNVIKDPPFSRQDMISCRNLLIYLNSMAQNRVMETFHFAMKPGAYLFLGSSESVDGSNDLFAPVNKQFHVFQSREAAKRAIPFPDAPMPSRFLVKATNGDSKETKPKDGQETRALERISLGDLHQRLLEQYAPPSLVVNESNDIVHLSESAGRFLRVAGGEPTQDVLKLVHEALRLELRTALYQAVQKGVNIEVKNLAVQTNGHSELINLHVRPVLRPNDTARGFVLIIFETSEDTDKKDVVEILPAEAETLTRHLEDEINNLKTQLRSSNEQFEVQNEELKASNEELQAMNEELRSAAEELETSKEELQSINEELITVNQELKVKVEETSQSNNDFLNLINSTDIGTIFLDRNLCVKLFTPAARNIFNLKNADLGRPLTDITGKLQYNELEKDIEGILQNLQTIEREISIAGGSTYLMQVSPYRTAEDHINGVVMAFVNITGRKKAEEALHDSLNRTTEILESINDAFYAVDADFHFTYVNKKAEELLGKKRERLIGKHFWTEFPEVQDSDSYRRHITVMETRQAQRYETLSPVVKGWIEVSIYPETRGGVSVYFSDIGERKQTEMALRDSEDRYRIALEAGELATWDWNIPNNKVVWNQQHFLLFGIDHEEDNMQPDYFLHFVYPEDLPHVRNELANVLGEAGIYNAEFRIRRKDNGKLRWMNGYGRVTERNEKGEATRVSGVMFDTTERREAEESLKATQNSLNTALEAAKMGVWAMDMTHGYVDRSAKHDELLGFPYWQEDWSREKAKTHIVEEDKKKFDAAYSNLMTKGVFELEARVNQPDGSVCWIYYYGRVFENENGNNDQAAGVIFDITERKTIEKQKDEFLGIASHELKTPVTSIKAYAEILQETFTEKEDLPSAELMGKLDSQVDRLTKLIKDLLDVTKVSEGQLNLTIEPFSLADLTRNMVEEMQRTTRQHRIKLTMINDLPDVKGDEERIGQVLTNLISNAIKYSPESKDVLVTASYENDKVCINVQDFGIGMSPGTLEKLFARFFRSDNPSVRSYPGLGLGLFISMEIMKRHNGTITVESKKGEGSLFTMLLPC